MTTLLHIEASPRGDRSHSRQLGRDYVAAWHTAHPTGRVVARDIGHEPPPFVSEAWVEGAFTPSEKHSAAAQAALAVSDRYVNELLAADQLLITTPLYNLSVPAVLKAWIDQIVRAGRTFTMTDAGFQGLVTGKKAIVVVASGSDLRPGTPGGAYNFLEPYLRGVLGFIGITQVEFVYAHSLNAQNPQREPALAAARSTLAELAALAA